MRLTTRLVYSYEVGQPQQPGQTEYLPFDFPSELPLDSWHRERAVRMTDDDPAAW